MHINKTNIMSIQVMQGLIDLGALQPTGDMSAVRRSIQFFLDNLLNQRPDQQQTLAAIGEDLFAIATDQPFRFPATFTFVIRAFSTLEGIGYILDPDFSFPKIGAPYAQELLDLRQKQRSGPQLVQEIRKQADDARTSTISMPYRVQRIEEIVKQLESGDLKLRVRVLESERAARKATILQMATMYTVIGGTLVNLGVTFSSQGSQIFANGSFIGAVRNGGQPQIVASEQVQNYVNRDVPNAVPTTVPTIALSADIMVPQPVDLSVAAMGKPKDLKNFMDLKPP
ncbi:hypothetical protein FXO37_08175 [Capsicum annuum]|nr:hypothetical protein FXO37_08175 [Capsicum annuum]